MINGNKKIEKRCIASTRSLLAALKQMDEQKVKMLFVFDKEHFVSILTIGDIQRAIVKNIDLDEPVDTILDHNKKYARKGEPMEEIRRKMLALRAECMPVLDDHGELLEVVFWHDLFEKEEKALRQKIDIPVVIS